MNKFHILCLLLLQALLYSCTTTKNYSPQKKYSAQQLQMDYSLLRNILEKKHPSLYWYTTKDSMDFYFNSYYRAITDSMTEQQFGWAIIAPLTEKIHCGHTSFSMSKAYNQWVDGKKLPSFPLFLRCWNDTLAISANLNRKDSILKRGVLVTSINGVRNKALIKTMFGYITEDGYAENINYIRLSSNFPYYHRNIYGISKTYDITYLDSSGAERGIQIPVFDLSKDSSKKTKAGQVIKKEKRSKTESRQKRLLDLRSLAVDTANNTAIITLNTFSSGNLRGFFRRTFRYIKNTGISHVVLDIRSNGGGRIRLSTLLTKYVSRVDFKVADTCFTVARSLRPYSKYIKQGFLNNIAILFLTKKNKDGLYHFGHWERKINHPKTTNHYSGNLYVLTNGRTFSAAALFGNAVKGQPGVVLLGEETGGGWHGNNGVLIPDITLPITKIKVRLPLFRLVQYNHVPKDGRGIQPDVYISTNYDAFLKGIDYKMQVVMEMIRESNKQQGISN
ncbi:MAG: S41 family peptidase [Ferruginibacter sp.]